MRVWCVIALVVGSSSVAWCQAETPLTHEIVSAEVSRSDALHDVAMLLEDMAEFQGRLEEANAELRHGVERAREHLHDTDPIEGALPPLAGMEMEALVELLCGEGTQPAARWASGG